MNTNQRNNELPDDAARKKAKAETSTLAIGGAQKLEFSEWLDIRLKALEEKYSDFETKHSNRDYFSRS